MSIVILPRRKERRRTLVIGRDRAPGTIVLPGDPGTGAQPPSSSAPPGGAPGVGGPPGLGGKLPPGFGGAPPGRGRGRTRDDSGGGGGGGGGVPSNVTFVGASGGQAFVASYAAHEEGDLLLGFAYRSDNTFPPSLPSGWTSFGTADFSDGGANVSVRLAYRVAVNGSTPSSTWSNATSTTVLVYRNVASIGAHTFGGGRLGAAGAGTVPALTLDVTDGSSWPVVLLGITTTLDESSSIAGLTNRSNSGGTSRSLGFDYDEGKATSPALDITGASSSVMYLPAVVELVSD